MAVTPYRQLISPGDVGSDVKAVKRAMVKMGVAGSGGLTLTNRAGPQFVTVLNTILRQHGYRSDGVYGRQAHAVIAPHFDLYGVALYRKAAIRVPQPPSESAQVLASQLLSFHKTGKYQALNPGDLRDIEATAAGKAVWSQCGYWVHVDRHPLAALVWLIEQGHTIGTYAICSDHHCDGPHGHSGGKATDIASIDGVSVATNTAASKKKVLLVAGLIRDHLAPWQLICGGYGNHRDADVSKLSVPAADSFYTSPVMAQHTNHLHAGW